MGKQRSSSLNGHNRTGSQRYRVWYLREVSLAAIVDKPIGCPAPEENFLHLGVCIEKRSTHIQRARFDLDPGMQEYEKSRVCSHRALQPLGRTHKETKDDSGLRWSCRFFPRKLEDRDTLFGFGRNPECVSLQRRALTKVS